jgi:hypothetical protein
VALPADPVVVEDPTPKSKASPSMIIHRTQDADADHVRTLRSAMEDALKQNATLKAEVINIRQDLAAMHEENAALKEIMRSLIEQKGS